MSLHKRAKNAATIRVTYPDGSTQSWQSRRDSLIARESAEFAYWLRDVADQIEETATTDGMCAEGCTPDDD